MHMAGHECFHCKQWVEEDEQHDCWTTTEAALTAHLSEDLREAWERLRETAVEFGPQRIYASHHSIMFSKKVCYCFVRPKAKYLVKHLEHLRDREPQLTADQVALVGDCADDGRRHCVAKKMNDEKIQSDGGGPNRRRNRIHDRRV